MYPAHDTTKDYLPNQIKANIRSDKELGDYLYALPNDCGVSIIESSRSCYTEYVFTLPEETDMIEAIATLISKMPCKWTWMFFVHRSHKESMDEYLTTLYEKGDIEFLTHKNTKPVGMPNHGLARYAVTKFLHTEYGRFAY